MASANESELSGRTRYGMWEPRMWLVRSAVAAAKLCAAGLRGQAGRRLIAIAIIGLASAFGLLPADAGSLIRISANTPVRTLDPAKFSLGALEYNFALLTMCLCLIVLGAGWLSIDHFLWRLVRPSGRKTAGAPLSPMMSERVTSHRSGV